MAALGKLRTYEGGRLGFWCPGCEEMHVVVHGAGGWSWNGSGERPTFAPSILVTYPHWVPPVTPENIAEFNRNPWTQTKVEDICHSFVRDGQIQFLGDCTHKLAGQTVELPMCPHNES